jgi:hypothetical protein
VAGAEDWLARARTLLPDAIAGGAWGSKSSAKRITKVVTLSSLKRSSGSIKDDSDADREEGEEGE